SGKLTFSTNDSEATFAYTLGAEDPAVLDMTHPSHVPARQVGRATLTVPKAAPANYEAASVEIAVAVAKKAVTIAAVAGQSKVYGAEDPGAYDYKLVEGDLAFDDELMDIVSATFRERGKDVGAYDIALTVDGARADNYAVTFDADNDAFAITPLEITVTAENQTKVFGTDDPA